MSWPKLDFSQTSKCRGTSPADAGWPCSPWLRPRASSARPAPPPRSPSPWACAVRTRRASCWGRGLRLGTLAEACSGYLKRQIHYLKWKYLAPGNLELAFSNPSFSPCPPSLPCCCLLPVNPPSGPSQKVKELCAGREYTVSVVCPTVRLLRNHFKIPS